MSQHLDVDSSQFTSQFILVEQDSRGDRVFYKRGLPLLPTRPEPTPPQRADAPTCRRSPAHDAPANATTDTPADVTRDTKDA